VSAVSKNVTPRSKALRRRSRPVASS
jgi:hypothetical protein